MILLDLFYDLLHLDIPAVCDSYDAALKSLYQLWNLTTVEEGFTYVASEGAAKLPRLSSTRFVFSSISVYLFITSSLTIAFSYFLLLFAYRPNLLDSQMALMLLTFIDAGLIEVKFSFGVIFIYSDHRL